MTTGIVASTWVYPIKGIHGIDTMYRGIEVDTQVGVVGDRTFAISKTKQASDQWEKKGKFLVAANTPGIAIEHGLTPEDLDDEYRPSIHAVKKLAEDRGINLDECGLLDTQGSRHNADNNKPYVSFLNLETLRELETFVGHAIDPRRFRMNVWVDNMPAFAELEYIRGYEQPSQYPMSISDIRLGCDNVCERCKAIDQNPKTGEYDTKLNQALMALLKERGYEGSPHRGTHNVMGWYAIPYISGAIHQGQSVVFPE